MTSLVPLPSPDTATFRPARLAAGFRRALLAGVLVLGFVAPAHAQYDLVTFDLTSESSVSLLGGTIVTPPDGVLTIGSLTLQLPSSAPGVPTPGATVLLEGFTLAGSISKNVLGQADVSGPFSADQLGPVSGTLAPGLGEIDFTGQSMAVDLDVNLACVGTGCGALGLPASESGVSAFDLGVLSAFDLDLPGSARLEALVDLEVAGLFGTLDLVAVETNRVFVPEPGTALLVGTALLLLGRRAHRSRRR